MATKQELEKIEKMNKADKERMPSWDDENILCCWPSCPRHVCTFTNSYPLCWDHYHLHRSGQRIEVKLGTPVIRRKIIEGITVKGKKTVTFRNVVKPSDVLNADWTIKDSPMLSKHPGGTIIEEGEIARVAYVPPAEGQEILVKPVKTKRSKDDEEPEEVREEDPEMEEEPKENNEDDLEQRLLNTSFDTVEEE